MNTSNMWFSLIFLGGSSIPKKKEGKLLIIPRNMRVYKLMSRMLKTRSSVQCRSHHIKLLRTFRNVNKIVANLQNKIGKQTYQATYDQLTSDKSLFPSTIGDNSENQNTIPKKKIIIKQETEKKNEGTQTDLSFGPCFPLSDPKTDECYSQFQWVIFQQPIPYPQAPTWQ